MTKTCPKSGSPPLPGRGAPGGTAGAARGFRGLRADRPAAAGAKDPLAGAGPAVPQASTQRAKANRTASSVARVRVGGTQALHGKPFRDARPAPDCRARAPAARRSSANGPPPVVPEVAPPPLNTQAPRRTKVGLLDKSLQTAKPQQVRVPDLPVPGDAQGAEHGGFGRRERLGAEVVAGEADDPRQQGPGLGRRGSTALPRGPADRRCGFRARGTRPRGGGASMSGPPAAAGQRRARGGSACAPAPRALRTPTADAARAAARPAGAPSWSRAPPPALTPRPRRRPPSRRTSQTPAPGRGGLPCQQGP